MTKKTRKTRFSDLQESERLFLKHYIEECEAILFELHQHQHPEHSQVDLDEDDWKEFKSEAWATIERTCGDFASLYFRFIDDPRVVLPKPVVVEHELGLEVAASRIMSWCHQAHQILTDAGAPILSESAIRLAEVIIQHPGLSADEINQLLVGRGETMLDVASLQSRYLQYVGFYNASGRGYFHRNYSDRDLLDELDNQHETKDNEGN